MNTREPIGRFLCDLYIVLETTQAARLVLGDGNDDPATIARGTLRLAEEKLRAVINGLGELELELNKPAAA